MSTGYYVVLFVTGLAWLLAVAVLLDRLRDARRRRRLVDRAAWDHMFRVWR